MDTKNITFHWKDSMSWDVYKFAIVNFDQFTCFVTVEADTDSPQNPLPGDLRTPGYKACGVTAKVYYGVEGIDYDDLLDTEEIGYDGLWDIEIPDSGIDDPYIDEMAREVLEEALENARKNLAKLRGES